MPRREPTAKLPVTPSTSRLVAVGRALGPLATDVVFIGGAIAPLLQTHPVMPRVRATDDVDALVPSASYARQHTLESRLADLGFTRRATDAGHAHRWRAPDGTPFDLVPAGEHLGGTGSRGDALVLKTATESDLEPGLTIRHANATGFLALKWAAFHDRGQDDPFASRDLEDILALTVSRDSLVTEFRAAPAAIRARIRDGFRWLIDSPDREDLVAAHLGAAQSFAQVSARLHQRIVQMLAE